MDNTQSPRLIFASIVTKMCVSTNSLRERLLYAYEKWLVFMKEEYLPEDIKSDFSTLNNSLQKEDTVQESIDNMDELDVEANIQKCFTIYTKLIESEKSK